MCPMYLGVRALLAKSIERIHFANLINFGIAPFLFDDPTAYDGISQGDRLVIDNLRTAIASDGRVTVRNVTRETTFTATAMLSTRQKNLLLNGGLLASTAGNAQ